jgi:hypothetical protein
MNTGRFSIGIVTLCILMEGFWLPARAGGNRTDSIASAQLLQRMDRLENRVTGLEAQVVTLKREKTAAQESLQHQQDADATLQAQMARNTASVAEEPSERDPRVSIDPRDERPRHDLISSYGVRAGYQGFPFGQKEGGFFYGLFLDHLLMQQSEGMPGGDLDLELGAAVAFSGNDELTVNSTVVGAPTQVDFRQRMISVWPALKYRYDRWQSYGFAPYLTGGPGIWVDIIETPPLVGGLQFPPTGLAGRKLPAIAGASLFEGAQGGAGFEYSLARLGNPVFSRMKVGFDYRYAAWTSGQRFSTYSLMLSYRD